MLVIDLTEIPAEGKDVEAALSADSLHLEAREDFTLAEGGALRCHVALGSQGLVQVTGRLEARLELTCGRCLEAFEHPVGGPVELIYLPREGASGSDEDEVGLADRDMVVAYYDGEQLDLGEMVREQLLLSLSMKRLCREDCLGLCSHCGANRNRTTCECPEAPALSPLAALGQVMEAATPTQAEGTSSLKVRT